MIASRLPRQLQLARIDPGTECLPHVLWLQLQSKPQAILLELFMDSTLQPIDNSDLNDSLTLSGSGSKLTMLQAVRYSQHSVFVTDFRFQAKGDLHRATKDKLWARCVHFETLKVNSGERIKSSHRNIHHPSCQPQYQFKPTQSTGEMQYDVKRSCVTRRLFDCY